MKKLMIVGGDILGETLKVVLAIHFNEVFLVESDSALETFLLEDPTHVLVSDMIRSPKDAQVIRDLRGANVSSRILRYGFDNNVDIQLPLENNELIAILMGEHKKEEE
ncbi:MAG: hypothetical protein WCO05_04360 [Candidatus Moraniibacteriota bacterium]